jgi:rubrerythrin
MTPEFPTSSASSIESVRAAFYRARFCEEAHAAAMRLLNSLEPRAPMWAREAVQQSYAAMVEANREEDRILDDALASLARQAGSIFLHSDFHPHNRMEPAEARCHACGRESSPGERWYVCDTCEDCRFEQGARS